MNFPHRNVHAKGKSRCQNGGCCLVDASLATFPHTFNQYSQRHTTYTKNRRCDVSLVSAIRIETHGYEPAAEAKKKKMNDE